MVRSILGILDNRKPATKLDAPPWNSHVELRVRFVDDQVEGGSGFLVGPRTIVTAAHCIYSPLHGVAASIEAVTAAGTALETLSYQGTSGWLEGGFRKDSDVAAAFLSSEQEGPFMAFAPDLDLGGVSTAYLGGFPVDKAGLWWHGGPITAETNQFVSYLIDSTRGQSGAPVFVSSDAGSTAIAIHIEGGASVNTGLRITSDLAELIHKWSVKGEPY